MGNKLTRVDLINNTIKNRNLAGIIEEYLINLPKLPYLEELISQTKSIHNNTDKSYFYTNHYIVILYMIKLNWPNCHIKYSYLNRDWYITYDPRLLTNG